MTRKDREKEKNRRMKRQQREAEARAQAETDADEEDLDEYMAKKSISNPTPEPEAEPVEKSYDMPMEMMYPMGPTSFKELDAEREAREMAEEVNQVTWDVQDLVRNILHDPLLEPPEKADRIKEVAGGYEERLAEMLDGEELEKDLDVLSIQATLAMESRAHSPLQKALEGVTEFAKRKLSYAARKKLPAGEFALPEKKKYPIHDKAHVRNALARAAQQIKAGGEGAADAKAALPKIRAAAKKMGIDVSMEKGIHIEKDAKGDWRWIGKPSNNFIDKQNDIMSKAAHQRYCAWLDENNDLAPLFLKWHTPGTARQAPVDFWMEHEGALIMSGKLTEDEAASLLRMQKQVDLGMSVQGLGLRLNPDDPREITHYWLYEVSDLPLDQAANPFTSLETITKEAGMDKLQYLTEMMGSKEKAEDFLKRTGQMQKELQEAGITSKADEAPADGPAETQPPAQPAPALDANALIEQIKKAFDLDGLSATMAQLQDSLKDSQDKVSVLEALVKDLQQSDEEKLAAQLTPPAMRYAWTRDNRASQAEDTKLKKTKGQDEEELEKAMPLMHWLSEVTHTTPIATEEV